MEGLSKATLIKALEAAMEDNPRAASAAQLSIVLDASSGRIMTEPEQDIVLDAFQSKLDALANSGTEDTIEAVDALADVSRTLFVGALA